MLALSRKQYSYLFAVIFFAIIVGFWQPHALIYGVQRGSLYALIGLPLALVLGILGVLNLAHGEFLTVGLYACYVLFHGYGLDPLLSVLPVTIILLILGAVVLSISNQTRFESWPFEPTIDYLWDFSDLDGAN